MRINEIEDIKLSHEEWLDEEFGHFKWCYHGTTKTALRNIQRHGLQSNNREINDDEDYDGEGNLRSWEVLYFTMNGPKGWGGKNNVELRFPDDCIRVNSREDNLRPDEYIAWDNNSFEIEPQYIQILIGNEWQPLRPDFEDL